MDRPAKGISMDLYEANTHPFIIKIWLEETGEGAGRATWRGHITHVPSGERRSLVSLGEIPLFVQPYLADMGVEFEAGRLRKIWRIWAYLWGCATSKKRR